MTGFSRELLVTFSLAIALAVAGCAQTEIATTGGQLDADRGEIYPGERRNAVLMLHGLELIARAEPTDAKQVIAIEGDRSAYECTSQTRQGLAACEQRCLAIQAELEDPNTPEGGCSSINNGCSCTSDPFDN